MSRQVAMIHWVPVDDQMPAEQSTVLVHCPGAEEPVDTAWFCGGQFWQLHDLSELEERPRHWAELPTPPDEEGDSQ